MATDIQKMRVLIPDNEQIFDGDYLFSDNDLNAYLEVANNSVLRAASYAVLAIATSEAMISKVIKTQDLSTNGAAVADALRLTAKQLADRADKDVTQARIVIAADRTQQAGTIEDGLPDGQHERQDHADQADGHT